MRRRGMSRRRLLGATTAVVTALATGGVWPARCRGKVYPGATVLGLDLGGVRRAEAATRLREHLAPFEATAVTYTWGTRSWTASVADLGVTIDYAATLDTAWRHGREGGLIGRYETLLNPAGHRMAVPLTLVLDEGTLERYLATLDQEVAQAPRDARLLIEGTEASIAAEQIGRRVDRGAARRETLAAIRGASPAKVPLREVPLPPSVTAADLQAARRQVATLLGAGVTVTLDERSWLVSPDDLAGALVRPDDPVTGRARLDPEALETILEPIAAEVNHPPRNATVAWDGGLYAIDEGYAGVEVELGQLGRDVAAAAATKARRVNLPLRFLPPVVDATNLAALGIEGHLASGSSSFAGSSAARATNVRVAAEHVSQTLVPPGGTFAFNDALGPISLAEGYVEGKIIAGDWYASDLGGGVCQVSTTVFRAALLAGLPFAEWHPHSFRLAFYELDGSPPGMDAAIYQPNTPDEWELDLVFTNPTEAWLLLQLSVTGETVTAELYGGRTGYEIEIAPPQLSDPIPAPDPIERASAELPAGAREQIQAAQPGVEVVMTRRVVKDGALLSEDTFVSPYQPQAKIFLVGTGES